METYKKFSRNYNYAFIDESTKREIRRKILKAVCIPGYQVPYSSPEMPIARGWGTGGLHVSLAIIGPSDVFKIIDQGSDASVNACNLRDFISMTTGIKTTFNTKDATIIQSRHRIPEEVRSKNQIIVLQVPQPEVLRSVEKFEYNTRRMHGEADYAKLWVVLYEAFVRTGDVVGRAVRVNNRYMMAPSPIPRWDIPQLDMAQNLHLFGAGREKRIYAVPPLTPVEPLEFDDVKFRVENFFQTKCASSSASEAFMDEIYQSKEELANWVINDSNFLDKILEGNRPPQRHHKYWGKTI